MSRHIESLINTSGRKFLLLGYTHNTEKKELFSSYFFFKGVGNRIESVATGEKTYSSYLVSYQDWNLIFIYVSSVLTGFLSDFTVDLPVGWLTSLNCPPSSLRRPEKDDETRNKSQFSNFSGEYFQNCCQPQRESIDAIIDSSTSRGHKLLVRPSGRSPNMCQVSAHLTSLFCWPRVLCWTFAQSPK